MNIMDKIRIEKKPTYRKFAVDVDFFELFRKIERNYDVCFIFESLGEEGKFSRYSIIGFDPEHEISARDNKLNVDGKIHAVANPYYALRDLMPPQTITREYAGGLIGYVGYDAVNYFEPSLNVKTHRSFDQFAFGVYTDGLILDKLTNEISYFYYETDRSDSVQSRLNSKVDEQKFTAKFIKDGITEKGHATIVEKVKEQIRAGNTFQCEVGFKTEYEISGDTLKIYARLREINPSPFMYYLKFRKKKVIGASPELLFSLREGEMTTRPLAGTIRRGADEKKDLMTIKKFSHVQHISSEIVATIKEGEDAFSGLASQFPMGTVCGTPKIETIKIINENEPEGRGPYGGGVGHFGFNGDCTFSLALRSVFIDGSYAYTQTSGGIVYDSVPEKEYDEVKRKSAAMREALGISI